MKAKVTILLPHFSEYIYTQSMMSIIQQYYYCSGGIITPSSMSKSLASIRNDLVKVALEEHKDSTHFLFLDGDELFPAKMVPILVAHDKDIVGAWTMIRQNNMPNVYNITRKSKKGGYWHKPYLGKGLEKVDRLGFGSILIKKEVFKKLKEPWFDFDEHHQTEDLYFQDKAREAGYDIWVDFNLRCGHLSLKAM